MKKGSRKFDSAFKARVALEAIKCERTMSELTSAYGVHSTQIAHWKKQALSALPGIFAGDRAHGRDTAADEALVASLYQQIGQLKVELDWLKKKSERFA